MTTSDIPPAKTGTTFLLNRLKEISSAVMNAAEAGSLEQVLEQIAHVSGELVNARYAALGIPDGKGGLRYFKVAGMSPTQVQHVGHLPFGHGLLGAIMQERKSVRLERMQDDNRSSGFCSGHPTMTSLLGVPIQVGDQFFGILYLCDRLDGQPFSEQDEWLVETIAGYAALAITGSELSEKQSRLTLLEERERIGMELHDGIIQSLYAVGMQLDLIRTAPSPSSADLKTPIDDLNNIIEDIRSYIMNLRASGYHRGTIYDYLHNVLARLYIPEWVTIEIHAPDTPPPFLPIIFEAICQMANEAISNALRHANASYINIHAYQDGQTFQITISDDGQGFDLNTMNQQSGLGLRNLQQRALRYSGNIQIDTAPGRGTTVTISIPLLSG